MALLLDPSEQEKFDFDKASPFEREVIGHLNLIRQGINAILVLSGMPPQMRREIVGPVGIEPVVSPIAGPNGVPRLVK